MRYTLQASGYSGGWTNIFNDTESELQANATNALRSAGFAVSSVVVEADEWDATARIMYDKFSYRLTATVESGLQSTQALAVFMQTIQSITGFPATVSNITAGDSQQPLPNSNPLPNIGQTASNAAKGVTDAISDALKKLTEALQPTLVTLAVLGVVVLIILNKER